MATSLASQLKALAVPQTSAFARGVKKRASLLFDPAEAAKYDYKDILQISLEGLHDLQQLNEEFSRFEEILFSPVSMEMERSVQNRELNAKLDENIAEFLRLLAPYFLHRPAHKALEWLIVRFHIHQYNVEAVMLMVLPYHDTNIFVRMVQVLEFSYNKKWSWLEGIQRKGVPLQTPDLLKYLTKQPWLLEFLLTEFSRRSHNQWLVPVHNDVFLKFMIQILFGLVYSVVDNAMLALLLPPLSQCLKSSLLEYRAAAYGCLGVLVHKVPLEMDVVGKIVTAMVKWTAQYGDEVGVVAVGVCAGKMENLPVDAVEYLIKEKFVQLLLDAMKKHRMDNLLGVIFRTSTKVLLTKESPLAGQVVDLMKTLLSEIVLEDAQKNKLIKDFVTELLSRKKDVMEVDVTVGRFVAVLRSSMPSSWNAILKERGRDNGHLLERLDMTLMNGIDEEIIGKVPRTTSIFLGLNHPNPVIRIDSMRTLMQSDVGNADYSPEFIREMVEARLADPEADVVAALLDEQAVSLLRKAYGDKVIDLLEKLLCRICKEQGKEKWMEAQGMALRALASCTDVAGYLPFLLMVLTTRNDAVFGENAQFSINFPRTKRVFSPEAPLLSLLNAFADDILAKHSDQICPAIKKFFLLLTSSGLELPAWSTHLTISLFIRVITERSELLASADGCALFDMVGTFLSKVSIYSRENAKDSVEIVIKLLKRGQLPSSVLMEWLERLFSANEYFLGDSMSRKVLLRAARLVMEGVKNLKHRGVFEKSVVLYVKKMVKVLKDVEELLLAVAEAGSEISVSLKHTILSLSAECTSLIPVDTLHDETAVNFLAVILPCLHSEHVPIRRSALQLCRNVEARHKMASPEVKDLLHALVANGDRMEMDGFVVVQVVADTVAAAGSERTREFWLDRLLMRPLDSGRLESVVRLEMLRTLRLVQSLNVLSRLYPIVDKLLNNFAELDPVELAIVNELVDRYSIVLRGGDSSWPWDSDVEEVVMTVVAKGLRLSGRLGVPSPAEVVLKNVQSFNKEKFGDGLFNRILNEILTVYAERKNPQMTSAFRRYLKHVRLPSALILQQLNGKSSSDATANDPKRRRVSGALARVNDPARKSVTFWRHANDLLEILLNKKKITEVRRLVEELCELLKESIVISGNEELMEQMEKSRQKIFMIVNFHCQRQTEQGTAQQLEEFTAQLDISAMVDCLRASNDLNTQLSGLALLASLAHRIPATILQSCMSIFSLTGSQLLHKEDEYSLNMILRIIDAIVPAILHAAPSVVDAVRSVWELFVDALPHIPAHRRGLLFGKLVDVTGEEGLWIGMVLLGNVYVEKQLDVLPEGKRKRAGYPVLCQFLEELFEGCGDRRRVESLKRAVEFVVAETGVFDEHGKKAKRKRTEKIAFDKPLINAAFSMQQRVELLSIFMSFISHYFPVGSVKITDESDFTLEALLTSLLHIQFYSRLNSTQSTAVERQMWAGLLAKSSSAVTEVLGKMSWKGFVSIMENILQKAEDESALKIALEELGGALGMRDELKNEDVTFLKPLVDTIISILREADIHKISEIGENSVTAGKRKHMEGCGMASGIRPAIQRGCFYCLRQLVGILGKDMWIPILGVCVDYLSVEDGNVVSEALLTIGAIVRCVKAGVLAKLPEFMPRVLDCLVERAKDGGGVEVVSGVDLMESCLHVLGGLMSPYMGRVMRLVAVWMGLTVKDGVRKAFDAGMGKLEAVVTGEIAFRMVFAAAKEAVNTTSDQNSHKALLTILVNALKNLPKPQIPEVLGLQRSIVDFLLSVLEEHYEASSILALDALSSLVLYMPDSVFRSLFMRIYQWALGQDSGERWVMFYRIVERLTDTLKHLFTIYASTVIGHALKAMDASHVAKLGDGGKKMKADVRTELLNGIFAVLSQFFKFDVEGFFNADQFDILMHPLVNQLDNFHDTVSFLRVTPGLITCIADFVACLNDDSLWKPLHYQVCLKTRSEIPEVRVAALQTLSAVAEKVGDAYGELLPEAMTFLVELGEDEDEGVERQCQETKGLLEKVLGQSTVWREELERN